MTARKYGGRALPEKVPDEVLAQNSRYVGPSNDANYVTIYLPFRAASIQVLPTLGSRDTVLTFLKF